MKRIRIVGLCLVAMFALGAVAATSASAELPEYKTCIKASPKESGKFNNKECTVASKGGKKEGDYELGEWNKGKKVTFTGKNGESTLDSYIPEKESEFWTGGTIAGKVVCKSGKSKGSITGPKTSTVTVEFKTCSSEGKKCTSKGAKTGTIDTNPLNTVLGFDEKSEVVSLVEGGKEGTSPSAAFNCEGLAIETTGSVLGVDTGNINKIAKESTQTFKVNAKGGQEVVFAGVPNESESVWGPGTGAVHVLNSRIAPPGVNLPSGENTTSVLKGEAMEIEA
jgi:hypothetical protein